MSKPECHGCRVMLDKRRAAVGRYGWQAHEDFVKADLCAEHAAKLRQVFKVIVLRSYRKRSPAATEEPSR